jgi:hypothetical protein
MVVATQPPSPDSVVRRWLLAIAGGGMTKRFILHRAGRPLIRLQPVVWGALLLGLAGIQARCAAAQPSDSRAAASLRPAIGALTALAVNGMPPVFFSLA